MQMMVCPKCGAKNYTSSRTNVPPCHNCGYDFKSCTKEAEDIDPKDSTEKPQ
ncbi:hypothetical protein [Candidatus Oleimmundimicrobium sp.]|uniref:hypothetical protein n=1 Tax=Candidatus Oleimmundimicrobium sp. TaxID=3060597 RepID=UPI002726204F|nr:hypothetical protein [Candidatus Oleimmundimicrobium sp.]MDO8885498.1 hypothetical protein [Candidatus Oleimmundimicrobium sp.]